MAGSGANELPSPARQVVEGVRPRAERVEAALREVLKFDTNGEQSHLRHWRRMRLVGESVLARGLSEERRAVLEGKSGDGGPFFHLELFRIDGWTLDANSRWQAPEDPRMVLDYHLIAPNSDPRTLVMDDGNLHKMIHALNDCLTKFVPNLKQPLAAQASLTTSVAVAREGMRLLVEAASLAERERDPDQRERRHARRLELIGLEKARHGMTEEELEPIRRRSGLAELLFEDLTLTTDGWTHSADGRWSGPVEAPGRTPQATG